MKAPFPWFGGKRRVADIVWERFGDPCNYVEPFAGSLAVLLERPTEPRCETVNDKDCYLSNFWRALQRDPAAVAYYCDWPVNEADLHARHTWLSRQTEFRERMLTDPDYFDVNIAGWWVWGLSMWIGGGWCGEHTQLKNERNGSGQHWRKRPLMKRGGVGVQRRRQQLKRVMGVHRSKPDLSGDGGAFGRGIHSCAMDKTRGGLYAYFEALAARLRRVRVCCGDWTRVMGFSPTTAIGLTAVFLDPPYSDLADRDPELYREDCGKIAHDVRDWAIANGNNSLMRIALCGYEGEHEMPSTWTKVSWLPNGGYANRRGTDTRGQRNKLRERIWFSPYCLEPELELFTNEKNKSHTAVEFGAGDTADCAGSNQ